MNQIHLIVFIFFSSILSFQVHAMEDQRKYRHLDYLLQGTKFNPDVIFKYGDAIDPTGLNLKLVVSDYKLELQSGQSGFAMVFVQYLKAIYCLQDGNDICSREVLIENIIPNLEKDICLAVGITPEQLQLISEIVWLKIELTVPALEECLDPNKNHGLNLELIAKRDELLRMKYQMVNGFETYVYFVRKTIKDLKELPFFSLDPLMKMRMKGLKTSLEDHKEKLLSFNILTKSQIEKIPPLD